MLPPNIAQLAARAKAADSLSIRSVDVTLTLLEGAVTEATLLVDERDELQAKLAASLSTMTTAVIIASEQATAAPEIAEWPHTEFLIWNDERGMWWKNARRGYTRDITDAGMYPADQAAKIVEDGCHAWVFYNRPGPPPEVMIPYTDDVVRASEEVRKARIAAIAAREASIAAGSGR